MRLGREGCFPVRKHPGHLLSSVFTQTLHLTKSTSRIFWNSFLLHQSQHPGQATISSHLDSGSLPQSPCFLPHPSQSAFCKRAAGRFHACSEGGNDTLMMKWTSERVQLPPTSMRLPFSPRPNFISLRIISKVEPGSPHGPEVRLSPRPPSATTPASAAGRLRGSLSMITSKDFTLSAMTKKQGN